MASTSSKKRCPNGLTCPVINILKHTNLFYHEKIDEDTNPGITHTSAVIIPSHVNTYSESYDAPGLNTSGTKSKRNCPKGIYCTLRNITKHEELFDHEEQVEEEAGAGKIPSTNFMDVDEDESAPGM